MRWRPAAEAGFAAGRLAAWGARRPAPLALRPHGGAGPRTGRSPPRRRPGRPASADRSVAETHRARRHALRPRRPVRRRPGSAAGVLCRLRGPGACDDARTKRGCRKGRRPRRGPVAALCGRRGVPLRLEKRDAAAARVPAIAAGTVEALDAFALRRSVPTSDAGSAADDESRKSPCRPNGRPGSPHGPGRLRGADRVPRWGGSTTSAPASRGRTTTRANITLIQVPPTGSAGGSKPHGAAGWTAASPARTRSGARTWRAPG